MVVSRVPVVLTPATIFADICQRCMAPFWQSHEDKESRAAGKMHNCRGLLRIGAEAQPTDHLIETTLAEGTAALDCADRRPLQTAAPRWQRRTCRGRMSLLRRDCHAAHGFR